MENLKNKTAKGIAWGALNSGATQLLNLVFGIFLGRLLTTEDYGLVALITIFTALAGCLQSAGFSQALANLKTPTREDYNAVAWFNLLVGGSIYVLLFFASPLIAQFFRQPLLTDLSRVAFLAIPLSAAGIVPSAKLWIELRNREQAVSSVIALFLSGCLGVALALGGYGYWSLVWQQLSFITLGSTLRYWFTRWCPTLPVSFRPIRSMFRFSSKLLLTNMLTILSQHLLTFIFGKLLPVSSVGLWGQANKWNTMGSAFVSNTMSQVAQPVLANAVGEAGRQERVFRKMLRFTSFVSFPLMFGFSLISHEFIMLTIGPHWERAAGLLGVLCIGGAFAPLHILYQNFVISRGRSGINLVCITLQIVVGTAVTLAFASLGIEAMVWAYSMFLVAFTVCWHMALRRITPISLLHAAADTLPFAAVAAASMVVAAFAASWTDSLWLRLAIHIATAAALYIAAMRLLNVVTFRESVDFLLKRKAQGN